MLLLQRRRRRHPRLQPSKGGEHTKAEFAITNGCENLANADKVHNKFKIWAFFLYFRRFNS